MRYKRLRVEGGTYFFTVVTHRRRPVFEDSKRVEIYRACLADVRRRHPFDVRAEVILPDHLHTIWTLPAGDADFSMRWRQIKSHFTRLMRRADQTSASYWQSRFWEHLIRDDADYHRHADYIHLNPVRHGYVSAPSEWRHSTFHEWVARGHYDQDWGRGALPE